MTPKVKIFENVFSGSATGHRTMFRDQIWWKSAVAKFPKGHLVYHKKNSRCAELVPAPISQNGPIAPKITWTLSPHAWQVDLSTYTEFGSDRGCVLPDLFRKDWFFGPKSHCNIRFQPTINYYTIFSKKKLGKNSYFKWQNKAPVYRDNEDWFCEKNTWIVRIRSPP